MQSTDNGRLTRFYCLLKRCGERAEMTAFAAHPVASIVHVVCPIWL
jgi:hypothetical protein